MATIQEASFHCMFLATCFTEYYFQDDFYYMNPEYIVLQENLDFNLLELL